VSTRFTPRAPTETPSAFLVSCLSLPAHNAPSARPVRAGSRHSLTVPLRTPPVMDRSPILFRCDANAQLGWEPFYQCLPYAAALPRRRRPAYFLGQVTPFPLLSQIVRGGNDYIPASHDVGTAEDCDETIREVRRLGAAAVIVNAPGVQEEYLRELSSTGTTVVVIDSEAQVRFPNRLIINPLLGKPLKEYEWEPGAQFLLGRKYAIVRSVFRRQ